MDSFYDDDDDFIDIAIDVSHDETPEAYRDRQDSVLRHGWESVRFMSAQPHAAEWAAKCASSLIHLGHAIKNSGLIGSFNKRRSSCSSQERAGWHAIHVTLCCIDGEARGDSAFQCKLNEWVNQLENENWIDLFQNPPPQDFVDEIKLPEFEAVDGTYRVFSQLANMVTKCELQLNGGDSIQRNEIFSELRSIGVIYPRFELAEQMRVSEAYWDTLPDNAIGDAQARIECKIYCERKLQQFWTVGNIVKYWRLKHKYPTCFGPIDSDYFETIESWISLQHSACERWSHQEFTESTWKRIRGLLLSDFGMSEQSVLQSQPETILELIRPKQKPPETDLSNVFKRIKLEESKEPENEFPVSQQPHKGVSLLNAAKLVNDNDSELAVATKSRWHKSRSPKLPESIGVSRHHKQTYLYKAADLCEFIMSVEPGCERASLLKGLHNISEATRS